MPTMSSVSRTPFPALALSLWVAFSGAARAADAGADRRAACGPELAQITALRQSVEACDASVRDLKAKEQACRTQAGADAERLATCRATARGLESSRDALCRAVGEFGRAIAEGESPALGGVDSCLSRQRQEQIAAELAAWRNVYPQLRGILLFANGERDALPPGTGPGKLPVERVVAELVESDRTHPPLLYRPMLAAALQRIAPRFWARLRARGSAAVDAWFAARGRLDLELVEETHHGAEAPQGPAGSAGPPIAAALKFVQTYLDIARCSRLSPSARDCGRARQLQEFLESSGTLVIERRVESIWAADCRTIGPGTLVEWVQEFPTSQQRVSDAQWAHVADSIYTKLQTCFLADTAAGPSATVWAARRLPSPRMLTGPALAHVNRLRQRWREDSDEEVCGRAVRELQQMSMLSSCELPTRVHDALATWQDREASPGRPPPGPALHACTELLNALWQGRAASVAASYARPPTGGEMVDSTPGFAATPMARLRALCDERRGDGEFAAHLRQIAEIAPAFGERPGATPWRIERASGLPIEQARYETAARLRSWARNLFARSAPCASLGLPPDRCATCTGARGAGAFDCDLLRQLEQRWGRWQRILWGSLAGAVLGLGIVIWTSRMVSAWRRFGTGTRLLRTHLDSIGIATTRDRFSWLLPSRLQYVTVELPGDAAWERWGRHAVLLRGEGGQRILDRDVNRAGSLARSTGAALALLVHDDGASPDLSAVRALLEWAARGSGRAVQVLPLAISRIQWLRDAHDVLEAVEDTSARGNPFELRGRVTSASQFFDRERLVSGLLGAVQAGNWIFVGGLRRFGKSSLALEVARRLPGPSAYVDLAAYHHEIASPGDPAEAADTILRTASVRLHEAAVARGHRGLPAPLRDHGRLGGAEVSEWYRTFALACAKGEGHRSEPILIVLDELEQAIGVAPELLPRALDVLSIVLGRLRGALRDPAVGSRRAGLLLCGAMHPVLWAPLPALAGQSVMGAFETVFVPNLPDDAATAMMRGLGTRQGIRFNDGALKLIIEEGRGVPILIRRLASSVLELYDPERARQGGLGAVEIGVEGAAAAVRREEENGAPLRVWVESEIADPRSVPGAVLRRIANEGRMTREDLRAEADAQVRAQFVATGIHRLLSADEQVRRAAEAAAVIVRMLGETGLLVPEGNPTSPDAYVFPDCLVRRILAGAPTDSAVAV